MSIRGRASLVVWLFLSACTRLQTAPRDTGAGEDQLAQDLVSDRLELDLANVTDVTDVTGVTDLTDLTDLTDVTDVSVLPDVSDVQDVDFPDRVDTGLDPDGCVCVDAVFADLPTTMDNVDVGTVTDVVDAAVLVDVQTACTSAVSCDNHLYCDGVETCSGNTTTPGVCVPGVAPCAALGRACREDLQACAPASCPVGTDVDRDDDGFASFACGGNDCDDLDALVFPNAAELAPGLTDYDCDGVGPGDPDKELRAGPNSNVFFDGNIRGLNLVEAGENHVCAVRSSGYPTCWGHNDSGQLGLGVTGMANLPEVVGREEDSGIELMNLRDFAAGEGHSCALLYGHPEAVCWGNNSARQLGDVPPTDGLGNVLVPTAALPGIGSLAAPLVQVAAGSRFTCAQYLEGGTHKFWCAGRNDVFQLGSMTGPATGVQVLAGSPSTLAGTPQARVLAAHGTHACALVRPGSTGVPELWCWGSNAFGESGANVGAPTLPQRVVNATWTSTNAPAGLALGLEFSCVRSRTKVWCWGRDRVGQLGNGAFTTDDSEVPVEVQFPPGVCTEFTQLVAGNLHACALCNTGSVYCWGANTAGQLGQTPGGDSPSPVLVGGLIDAVSLTAGAEFTCARRSNGEIACFGLNDAFQLGANSPFMQTGTPVRAAVRFDAVDVSAGRDFSCARRSEGGIYCWGANDLGQSGTGSGMAVTRPTALLAGSTFAQVRVGATHACAVENSTDGTVWCWGDNAHSALGAGLSDPSSAQAQLVLTAPSTPLLHVERLAVGEQFACALRDDRSVWCWGRNDRGQLGDNSMTDREYAVQVSANLPPAWSLEAGNSHVCAAVQTGEVWCWGEGLQGQLGAGGSIVQSAVPTRALLTSPAVQLVSGENHVCVRSPTGTLACWGDNQLGQFHPGGMGLYVQPFELPELRAEGLVAGGNRTCWIEGLGTLRALKCFGEAPVAELGSQVTVGSSQPRDAFQALANQAFPFLPSLGRNHWCVLTKAHELRCAGRNNLGQVGNGTSFDWSTLYPTEGPL